MRAVVTGASGLLGGNLALILQEAGHQVVCTRRAGSRVAHLDHAQLTWVEADLADEEAMRRAFDGADWVFHNAAAVTVRQKVTPTIYDANVTGAERAVRACQAAGARMIFTSSTVTIGLATGPEPADETSTWNLPERGLGDAYAVTKREGEARALAAAKAGADVVVVNPGYMFGPYDTRPSSGKVLIELHRGAIPALTPGTNSFVDVRDVARGMILAAERGVSGERYILAGHNLSYTDAFPMFAEWLGVKAPRFKLPYALCAPIGWAGDLMERLGDAEPLINSSTVGYGFCPDFRFSSKKAEAALGYTIGPLQPAVMETMAWFKQARMV